jgi:hypothetical protein
VTKSERFRKEILELYLFGEGRQAHVFEMPNGALVHDVAYFSINVCIPNFDTAHSSFQAFFFFLRFAALPPTPLTLILLTWRIG